MERKKAPVSQAKSSAATAQEAVPQAIDVVLTFFCDGTCQVSEPERHMAPGDRVELKADGVDVKITFQAKGSPFVNNASTIKIPEDTSVIETVNDSAYGPYRYRYSCSKCPTPEVSPEMIVP